MPLPNPRSGEKRADFVSRCMKNETVRGDFKEQDVRLGVCFTQWRKKHPEDKPPNKEKAMSSQTATAGGTFVSEAAHGKPPKRPRRARNSWADVTDCPLICLPCPCLPCALLDPKRLD